MKKGPGRAPRPGLRTIYAYEKPGRHRENPEFSRGNYLNLLELRCQ